MTACAGGLDTTIDWYIGYDGAIELGLSSDGEIVSDLSGTTRITFEVEDQVIDSSINPAAITWTTHDANGNDKVVIKPRGLFTAEASGYATLVYYDGGLPNGVPWITPDSDNRLLINIKTLS